MTALANISTNDSSAPILEPLGKEGASTVAFGEVVRLAFDSLLANKVRAFLTMLGVIIGVASVVALLSIGGGASDAITASVSSAGTNTLTVMPGSPENRGPGNAGTVQTLTLGDAEAIAALGLPIIGPAPQFGNAAQVIAPAADAGATVTGVVPAYATINSLALAGGSFISDEQLRGGNMVVVLGSNLAAELFGSGEAVGQQVRIKNQSFRVIGVLEEKGSGGLGASVDDQALVPLSVAQQRLFGARTPDGNGLRISSIAISVPNTDDIPYVQEQIKALLRERHQLAADGSEDDFDVFDQASLLSTLNTVTSMLTFFLGAVAAISLLVGGIGIMNIMLVSVSERTREIGLRKAVGARGQDILMQFVVEALVLSTAGGLIGLAVGSAIPIGITLLGILDAPVTWNTALIAVGFSMAVGLFFGIYPARRAARLEPITALRHE